MNPVHRGSEKTAQRINVVFVAVFLVAISACGYSLPSKYWTYSNPPGKFATALPGVLDKNENLWCDSREGAIYMAQTGWLANGCQSGSVSLANYQVTSLEKIEANDVRMILVTLTSAYNKPLFIPLPDHRWA